MIGITEFNAMAKRLNAAYENAMQPLCKSMALPFTAVAILMYFANNPDKNTANELCECRGYKRAIVSIHVERLVQLGYLKREGVFGDRRKCGLVCTEKAAPFIKRGREYQKKFGESVMVGIEKDEFETIIAAFAKINANIDLIQGTK